MKKYLIIILAFGLTLTSCQKGDVLLTTDVATKAVTTTTAFSPNAPCMVYRIYNPRGPMGTELIYEYTDCNGLDHTGYLDPFQMIVITARPGTVRCPGGNVRGQ